MRTFTNLTLLLLIGGVVFVYRDEVRTATMQMYAKALPCASPITYRIGTVDEGFNTSRSQYLSTIEDATSIWEKGSKRDLFAYDPEKGSVVINLVYDYRQQIVNKLQTIGFSIDDTQASYDQMKAKYDALKSTYDQKKAALEMHIVQFQNAQHAYNAEVQEWNARGGAPKNVYEELQMKKAELQTQRAHIDEEQNSFNAQVETINTLASSLNRLVDVLHLQASKYNMVGEEIGGEFEEGVFESKLGTQKIDIFEFADRAELTRVLAHELGHALGLEHVEDADAIMYRLNQSANERMTPADLRELERVCGTKSDS
jgi:predicted Zn-dependent protease